MKLASETIDSIAGTAYSFAAPIRESKRIAGTSRFPDPEQRDSEAVNDSVSRGEQSSITASSGDMRCPICGATNDLMPAVELRSSFNWLIFLAGGLLAVICRNAGRKRKMRCNQCGAIFETRSSLSKLSLLIFWLLICPTVIFLICVLGALILALFSN